MSPQGTPSFCSAHSTTPSSVDEAADGFERIYRAVTRSATFAAAVHAAAPGLPPWLVPFDTLDAALLERVERALSLRADALLVDIGCGTGGVGIWIAERTGAALAAVDIAPAAIAAARALARTRPLRAPADFTLASATATGLPSASAHAALCIDVLMFVEPEAAARELHRVLRPGGVLVATAAETLDAPFMPNLVQDYAAVFAAGGFRIREHDRTIDDAPQLALYRALLARAEALRAEMGDDVAGLLLDEAENGLQRAESGTKRVRSIFLVAERPA
jgi:SAM-dependent methyltransferase